MTADEFRAALASLGITQRWLAGKMRVHVSAVNRWAQGDRPVPGYVECVLELLPDQIPIASADQASHRPETQPSGAH